MPRSSWNDPDILFIVGNHFVCKNPDCTGVGLRYSGADLDDLNILIDRATLITPDGDLSRNCVGADFHFESSQVQTIVRGNGLRSSGVAGSRGGQIWFPSCEVV